MKKNLFNQYIQKFLDNPLWIKQALFIELAKEMRKNCCNALLNKSDAIFAVYVPTLTFKGETELKEKKCGFDNNIYKFLQECLNCNNILQIATNSFLSMEETARYFHFCLEQDFLQKPSEDIYAISEYIAGKTRLGEYLVRIGKITQTQLDEALATSNGSKKFGEFLVSKDLITFEEIKALLVLKNEATKRFVLDYNEINSVKALATNPQQSMIDEIDLLKDENKKLKMRLKFLLRLMNG